MTPREFLRAPGYDIAVLLSWSIDPVFFETVHLAHLRRGGSTRVVLFVDRKQLDARLPDLARQANRGRVRQLGRSYSLESVQKPAHFHPKVWLRLGEEGALVMVGSGNLTAQGWGGQAEVVTSWPVGPDESDKGGWVRGLLSDAKAWSLGSASQQAIDRALALDWLPAEVTEASPVLWTERMALSTQLERRWERRRFDRVEMLTGSTDKAGAMLRWANRVFGVQKATIWVTPANCSFLADDLCRLPVEVELLAYPGERPLHAKVAWFDGPGGPAAIVGSANCSSGAWLPREGGVPNLEAVAVYDAPSRSEFEKLLQEKAGEPFLARSEAPQQESGDGGVEHDLRITSASWDSVRRRLALSIEPSPEGSVQLLHDGDRSLLTLEEAEWTCAFEPPRWPVMVRVEADGARSALHWVDDERELVSGHRNRRWEGALTGFSDASTVKEQRLILRDLSRLSEGLFQVAAKGKHAGPLPGKRAGTGNEVPRPTLDPTELASAAVGRAASGAGVPHHFHQGASLSGILSAVFRTEDHDPEENTEKKQRSSENRALRLPPKLVRQLQRSLATHQASMLDAKWLRQSTGDQFFQAMAVPIALSLLALESGWIGEDERHLTTPWVEGVVDLLQRRSPFRRALERHAREEPERFGDGKLIATLRVATSVVPWEFRLHRALMLQIIDTCAPILGGVEADELGNLLIGVRVSEDDVAIRDQAFRDALDLHQLEAWLAQHWESLGGIQVKVDWFRKGELVWLKGPRRWARLTTEVPVRRNVVWAELLSGAPLSRGLTDRGYEWQIQRVDDRPILLNLHALARAGVRVPVREFPNLSEVAMGRGEKRGVALRW